MKKPPKEKDTTRWKDYHLVPIVKEERRLVWGLAAALVLQAGVSMVQPWPLKVIFDSVILDKPAPKLLKTLSGQWWNTVSDNLLVVMIIALIVVAVANAAALYIHNIAYTRLSQRVVQKLRLTLFAHILSLPISHAYEMGAGDVIERVTTDTEDSQKLIEGGSTLVFRSIPTFIGIILIMFWVEWVLAAVTLILAPVLVWATYFFGTRVKRATRAKRRHESAVATVAEVARRSHKWLKILGLEPQEVRRMEEKTDLSRDAAVEAGTWQGFYTSTTNVVLAVGTAVLILLGVWRIEAGQLTPGELLVFMSYLRSLYKPIRELTKYYMKMTKAVACLDRVEEVMRLTPCDLGVCERPETEKMPPFERDIVFKDVSFAYTPDRRVLDHVSFTMKKGLKIAVVGDSGSGKSTLLGLLPRFFDATGGRILIDGRDIRSFSLESLRKQIGIVTQEVVLFHATVRENIALGRPEEEVGDAEIEKAAELANVHEFLADLPDGYDTELSSGSLQLSGGQAKRILIARAFLRNSPIVLLDEPSSGLDPASEAQVMEAFDRLMTDKTVLITSHRLPVIANSDLILVLRAGRIIESGTHQELMDRSGVYFRFWTRQVRVAANTDSEPETVEPEVEEPEVEEPEVEEPEVEEPEVEEIDAAVNS